MSVIGVLGLTAVSVAVAGGAFALVPGASGVISGCYEKKTGIVRVVDAEAGANCKAWENPLSWNQAGAQGPAGPSGVAGIRQVDAGGGSYASQDLIDYPLPQTTRAWCAFNTETIVSGGYEARAQTNPTTIAPKGAYEVASSRAVEETTTDGHRWGWEVVYYIGDPGPAGSRLNVTATCAALQ